MKITLFVRLAVLTMPILLCGCLASQMIGDAVRSGQKNIDIVLAEGVTPEMLQQKKNIGININGVNSSTGQFVVAMGQGATNASVYSDMLTKEFMKIGYHSKSISETLSESMPPEKYKELSGRGFDILLIGNMNLSMTSSSTAWATGGEYANTGVISFTVKGLDPKNGDVLFILSAEYGKAKNSGEVTKDLCQLYSDVVMGKAKPTK
jgi:hypothetical protein